MTGFNIILVFAIILFARLGVRLFVKWKQLKNESSHDEDEKKEDSKTRE
ncbi:hypothetical protein O3Q51_09955 [Cryomorphaceae bacterium 1068]|nr:hypothetical protein [Cryomorphaceae bacterium 1068]